MKTRSVFRSGSSVLLSGLLLTGSAASAFELNPQLVISGFGTGGASMTNAVNVDVYNPITKEKISAVPTIVDIGQSPTFTEDTLGAVQFVASINDALSFTAQFVSEGRNDYFVETDWLFVDWRINDHWDIKVGRVRIPLYMHSQYLKVGYAYPWTRPPLEVYRVNISDFNGVLMRNVNFIGESWESDMTLGVGNTANLDRQTDTFFRAEKGVAFEWIMSNDFVKLRAGFLRADLNADPTDEILGLQQLLENPCAAFGAALSPQLITLTHPDGLAPGQCQITAINSPLPLPASLSVVTPDNATAKYLTLKNIKTEFYSLGYEIEWKHLISIGEWVRTDTHDSFLPDSQAWYVLLGLSWENIMPYLTYSTYRSMDDSGRVLSNTVSNTYVNPFSYFGPLLPIPSPQTLQDSLNQLFTVNNVAQSTIDAGIRYDIAFSTALKFDYRYVIPQRGTAGFFDIPPGKRISWVTAVVNIVF